MEFEPRKYIVLYGISVYRIEFLYVMFVLNIYCMPFHVLASDWTAKKRIKSSCCYGVMPS